MTTARAWPYINIPFRPHPESFTTYTFFSYEDLPPISDETYTYFNHYKTVADVKQNPEPLIRLLDSPTSCFIPRDEDEKKDVIYNDQQDCIIWQFNEEDRVYVKRRSTGDKVIVAD